MSAYLSVKEKNTSELLIKKSRFIVTTAPVTSEEAAQSLLEEIRKQHYKAEHNCYAYAIGQHKRLKKFSDDGEPSRTAGRPIMSVIDANELTDIIVIVTRYFGGVKLGAPGLVRAYSQSASLGIQNSVIIRKELSNIVSFKMDYALLGKLQAYFSQKGYFETSIDFAQEVTINAAIPVDETQNAITHVYELTNAQVRGNIIDTILNCSEI